MTSNEDLMCVECCEEYSWFRRVPRILRCKHTFCSPCLEKMTIPEGSVNTVTCPLCRWITCTDSTLTVPGALWVNTEIWDQISVNQQQRKDDSVGDLKDKNKQLGSNLSPTSKKSSVQSAVRSVFGRFRLHKRHTSSH